MDDMGTNDEPARELTIPPEKSALSNQLTELAGNPRRQAVASTAGTIYQAWMSIDAWLRLAPDEILFLEGAEDFDIVGNERDIASQVKARAQGISLGSQVARETLENFWDMATHEPFRRVSLHYLTTSSTVLERDADFLGSKGIEAWKLAGTDHRYATRIVAYLKKKLPPTSNLEKFLGSAPIEDIQDRLIRRIHWFTEQPGLEEVIQRVRESIVVLLDERKRPVAHADTLLHDLYFNFSETIVRPLSSERKLTKAALLDQLERSTNILVPVDRLLSLFGDGPGPLPPEQRSVSAAGDIEAARSNARTVSDSLRSWQKTIEGEQLERPELSTLLQRIEANPSGTTLVVGEAGSGKSALLSELACQLEEQGITVFALKADLLPPDVKTLSDISLCLGIDGDIESQLKLLANSGPVVLMLDQLDAVSAIMDQTSQRMRLLLLLASKFRSSDRSDSAPLPVHVLVSSRPFEAEHDARFKSLGAEITKLTLPPFDAVERLLTRVDISTDRVSPALRQTLRRPFALGLFVQVVRTGTEVQELTERELLDTWLRVANLGDASCRQATLSFLSRLASDLTRTETLWRPVDSYEIDASQGLRTAEASGLIIRLGNTIGFSHQAWLDDFQAKSFLSGDSLASYAWSLQDGLFARATVLRGLQRLRAYDAAAYRQSLDLLLGSPKTRRHLCHLLCDLIATQSEPTDREKSWVLHFVREDVPLARRALAPISANWGGWRSTLKAFLPRLMLDEQLSWNAIRLLTAEAAFESNSVVKLVESHWPEASRDSYAFKVFSDAALWSPPVIVRVREILSRGKTEHLLIVRYAKSIGVSRSAQLIGLYLETVPYDKESQDSFYGLEELAATEPISFARVMLPWFGRVASRNILGSGSVTDDFPRSHSLPFDWDQEGGTKGLFDSLKKCAFEAARNKPEELLPLLMPLMNIEVMEVQSLVADLLASAGGSMAQASANFLLGDVRRLRLGSSFSQHADGVIRSSGGSCTKTLLRSTVPHLPLHAQQQLRDAIESWDPFTPEAWSGSDAATRRQRRRWADELRFPLLEELPSAVLSRRRKRQVDDWRAIQPFEFEQPGLRLLKAVESPMSADRMIKASDDDLFRMLDAVPDGTDRYRGSSNWPNHGGTEEIAREFATFAKSTPIRALTLAKSRFVSSRHQNACGQMLRALASSSEIPPESVLLAVRHFASRGFSIGTWRRDAAWAMRDISENSNGLEFDDIQLLESWLIGDSKVIENQIAHRQNLELQSKKNAQPSRGGVKPIVFRLGNGFNILPQHNFDQLSAICSGLLRRNSPDVLGWLQVLERHIHAPEDPVIWSAVLQLYGHSLYSADNMRVQTLFERLWERFPQTLSEVSFAPFLWSYQSLIPMHIHESILSMHLSSDDERLQQAGGELVTAFVLTERATSFIRDLFETQVQRSSGTSRQGVLLTAARAWRENSPSVRRKAHSLLMQLSCSANSAEAQAVAYTFDRPSDIVVDELSKQILKTVGENPELLRACTKRRFATWMQQLLLHPGFEETVLEVCEALARMLLTGNRDSSDGMITEALVEIAVSLQRTTGGLRPRAMNLYEQLLDAGAYGANEAAEASLIRH